MAATAGNATTTTKLLIFRRLSPAFSWFVSLILGNGMSGSGTPRNLKIGAQPSWDGFHQIVIRTLSGFRYLCQQLAYLVLSRIFLIASKIGELLGRYQEYPAKSVGKQEVGFLIVAIAKNYQDSLSGI
jgi:hypothetical protein